MRKVFLWVILLSLPFLAFSENTKAPNFSLKDSQGKVVKLSDFKGKVIILDFWATWCPPCKMEIPNFVKLQKKYKKKGLQIIGISLDRGGARVVKPFAKEYKMNYPVLLGNMEVVRKYGPIQGIPTTFIIDKHGNIVEKFIGFREKEIFESYIRKLLSLSS